jgi:hypothetical protein
VATLLKRYFLFSALLAKQPLTSKFEEKEASKRE